jgi:uncharacterized protein YcbK (DUF882 family)
VHRVAAALASALCAALVASPSGVDATPKWALARPDRRVPPTSKKAADLAVPDEHGELLATLVQTHTEERVPLDALVPSQERFSLLLSDRVTGEHHALDPRLLDLLRALARRHADAGPLRFELVSGFRSPKLNEMLRKKGHHVASKSQHSLGHAVDFRIVLPGKERGIDPRVLEEEIRALKWDGGVGVYTLHDDWFVHADVGNNRRWDG